MRNRQDEDAFRFYPIDNAIGENRNADSPDVRENGNPGQWMTTGATDRSLDDVKESLT
ncbi:MAG TPA: hypothetical protein VLV54_02855 [Thermoanaerobaculia bacterium]|nr:hypothetical protein [Thermoanaerobaculia bacterium]